jgi:F0F1-type ATP synthase membrane subunit c/vacuolar-type H+-ATPase subunit K
VFAYLLAAAKGNVDAGKAIALALGIGLGSLGAGIGIGNIFGSMIQAVARQPELRGELPHLVAPPATFGGAWPAGTRRQAASSVAPGLSSPSAPCVLAWLGAHDPGIHQCHQRSH